MAKGALSWLPLENVVDLVRSSCVFVFVSVCPGVSAYDTGVYLRVCPQKVRVEHKISRTMCGTTVQAIWDYKNLTELAGGVREGQNLPQNGLNLALEPSRGPQIGL